MALKNFKNWLKTNSLKRKKRGRGKKKGQGKKKGANRITALKRSGLKPTSQLGYYLNKV